MLTANLARSSGPLAVSSSCIAISSGASKVNSSPKFSKVCESASPTSNFTCRGEDCPVGVTEARNCSVAAKSRRGFIGSPIHCT